MVEGLLLGLQTVLSIKNLMMVVGGCLIGTFIGMLPGLGPMSIIAIMIPVAISIGDPAAALILRNNQPHKKSMHSVTELRAKRVSPLKLNY